MPLAHTTTAFQVHQYRLLIHGAFVWIVFVNMVFIVKYAGRTISLSVGLVSAIAYAVVMIVGYRKYDILRGKISLHGLSSDNTKSSSSRYSNVWKLLCAIVVILWLALLYFIPKETLNVDRWLMVQTFWDNIKSGVYPYIPRYNQNIPSQLPVYHILAYPFYAIGEVGLLSVSVFVCFILFLSRRLQTICTVIRTSEILSILIMTMMVLPAFWWEASTRSTIIINSMLGAIVADIVLRLRANTQWFHYVVMSGLLCGALCSTRISMAFPMAVSIIYSARRTSKRTVSSTLDYGALFMIGVTALSVVLLCTVPLYLWKPTDALLYNPLAVQSQFAPQWFSLLLLGLSIGAGLKAKSEFEAHILSGYILLIMIIPHLINMLLLYGWEFSLYGNAFDISYFLQSLPYFFLGWCMYQASSTQLSVSQKATN